jgi:hypothetical protein
MPRSPKLSLLFRSSDQNNGNNYNKTRSFSCDCELHNDDDGRVHVKFNPFLCTVLNGGERLASRSCRFCPIERPSGTHMELQQPPNVKLDVAVDTWVGKASTVCLHRHTQM